MKKLVKYFTVKWEGLDGMFNLAIAKLFFVWFSISTIIAKLLSNLSNPLPIKIHNMEYSIPLELPFNWLVLWGASLAYFVAMLIYFLWCPKFVKEYPKFDQYKAKGHDTRWLVGEFSIIWPELDDIKKNFLVKRLKEKNFAEIVEAGPTEGRVVDERCTYIIVNHEGKNLKVESCSGRAEDEVRGFWWELQARWAEQSIYARIIIRILTTIAFGLSLWVVIQNILFVIYYVTQT